MNIEEVTLEREERRNAEVEFVKCAYNPEEAKCNTDGTISLLLFLNTHNAGSSNHDLDDYNIKVELLLSMPTLYPDSTSLQILRASIVSQSPSQSSSSGAVLKTAINALPQLIQACREVADENLGQESILSVFQCADIWVQDVWPTIFKSSAQKGKDISPCSKSITSTLSSPTQQVYKIRLGRRAIFSHHIINTNKRKFIIDLAKQYQLGGYMKIGWPGIILLEGEEHRCLDFWNEIRRSRWQYLTTRHEESFEVKDINELNHKRKFGYPCEFHELGKNDMSILAQYCRTAGLEYLFLSAINMSSTSSSTLSSSTCDTLNPETKKSTYSNNNGKKNVHHEKSDQVKDENDHSLGNKVFSSENDKIENSAIEIDDFKRYGILVHVDHMNDEKRYQKWLYRTAKEMNCSVRLHKVLDPKCKTKRQLIVVTITGDEISTKQFMKKWRTSSVDINSKGKPCLERQMKIFCEGFTRDTSDIEIGEKPNDWMNDAYNQKKVLEVDIETLCHSVEKMGGISWREQFDNEFSL